MEDNKNFKENETKKSVADEEVAVDNSPAKSGEKKDEKPTKASGKDEKSPAKKPGDNKKIIIIAAVAVVVIAAIILAVVLLGGKGNQGENNNQGADNSQGEDGTGNGTGNGTGDGTGGDSGSGTGDGTGNGTGDGTGSGSGSGTGDGTGSGSGSGTGDGTGEEEELGYTKGLFFKLNENGDYTVSVGNANNVSSIVIPEEYNGKPVVAIDNDAFYECTNVVSITIPETITSIGNRAFSGCVRLVEVINNSSLKITVGSAENGSVAENALEVHSGESKLVKDNGMLFYTFNGKNHLVGYDGDDVDVTLPEKYNGKSYLIRDYAFYRNYTIKNITIPEGITYIGAYAFGDCSSLEDITIPDSVTELGASAFLNCRSLQYAKLGNSISAIKKDTFANCDSLWTVDMGKKITDIGDYAFSNCRSLVSITVPQGVNNIGFSAFYYCTKLKEVINKSSLNIVAGSSDIYYGGIATYAYKVHSGESEIVNQNGFLFYTLGDINYLMGYTDSNASEIVLPDSFNGQSYEIFYNTFYSNRNLISVVIGENVTKIAPQAFDNCKRLVEVINKSSLTIGKSSNGFDSVPQTVLTIHTGESELVNQNGFLFMTYDYNGKNYLVGYNGNETKLVLPENFNGESYDIYQNTFSYCYSLTEIVIPDCVSSIGKSAFSFCYSLRSISVGSGVTNIDESAFLDCKSIKFVNIDNLESWCNIWFEHEYSNPLYLKSNLYLNNQLITDLVIPDGVTEIGNYTFYGLNSITSVYIPSSVTCILKYAFQDCRNLTDVIISDGVTEISWYAFNYCYAITDVYYTGSEEQWKQINIIIDGNATLAGATIHYNYIP